MSKSRSIKQNRRSDALPNFRNLGVTLRILLISNGVVLVQSVLLASSWSDVPQRMLAAATLLEPVLLASLLLLWAVQPWVERLDYQQGALAVTGLVLSVTLLVHYCAVALYPGMGNDVPHFDAVRYGLAAAALVGILLLYFRLRSSTLSHAMQDARLQVLRARIRPHFLFNSINAVLGTVRAQPKLAEAAMEDMADLFRMAMSEEEDLVPLRKEVGFCRQYIALEQLRMGDRLKVSWDIQGVPDDALIPPLVLQPLLENAVYHGIELLPEGGCIEVLLRSIGDKIQIRVANPYTEKSYKSHQGHKIALRNIRERLDLLFDVEAQYQVDVSGDRYSVEIVMPYVKEKST